MRILMISNLYPPNSIGGYELFCKEMFEEFSKNNFETYILTCESTETFDNETRVYRKLKTHHNFGTSSFTDSLRTVNKYNTKKIREIVKALNPEIILFWNTYGLGWEITTLKFSKKIKIFFYMMDYSFFAYFYNYKILHIKFLYFFYFKLKSRKIKKQLIFASHFLQKKLIHQINLKNIVYPGLKYSNIKKVSFYNNTNKRLVSVYIGQIAMHKGVRELLEFIKAFNQNNDLKIEINIYTQTNIFEKLEIDQERIKIGVGKKEILNNLNRHDLGFFPSQWEEPFGLSQLEMLSQGLPVISTGMGGSKEMSDYPNLFLYDKSDYPSFERAIYEAIKFNETRDKHVINKIEKINRAIFSIERTRINFVKLFFNQ